MSFIRDWGMRYRFINGMRTAIKCMHDFMFLLNEHSLNLKLQYHKRQKSGKLASKYIKASDALESIINDIIFWFLSDILMLLFVLIFMALFIHWLLFLLMAINIFVYILVTLKYSKPAGNYIIKTIKSYEDALGFAYDSISNVQLVKANSREEYENKKVALVLKDKTREYFERFLAIAKKESFFQETISTVGIFILFIAMFILLKNEVIAVWQIITVVGYLGLLRSPMRKMGMHIDHYRRWMGIIKYGYELLDEEIEPYNKKGAVKLKKVEGVIEFRKINFC